MSRDWKKDMETVERFKYFQTLCHGIPMLVHGQTEAPEPVEVALEYWLQQYAVEKERADKANESYRLLRKLYDEQCSEKMEYYNEMVKEKERANKLITKIRKLMVTNNFGPLVKEDLNFAILSLYPKEETKPALKAAYKRSMIMNGLDSKSQNMKQI